MTQSNQILHGDILGERHVFDWPIALPTHQGERTRTKHFVTPVLRFAHTPSDLDECGVYLYRLSYVEATILELLRYKTIAPLAIAHCTLKDAEVGGYFIPKGTSVS